MLRELSRASGAASVQPTQLKVCKYNDFRTGLRVFDCKPIQLHIELGQDGLAKVRR